jgi:hypothetical protein
MKKQKTENNPIHNEKYKYMLSPRCGAKTRKHTACLSPAIRGKHRCRMHGGKGSGAPKGTKNALTHGCATNENYLFRKKIKKELKEAQNFLDFFDYLQP